MLGGPILGEAETGEGIANREAMPITIQEFEVYEEPSTDPRCFSIALNAGGQEHGQGRSSLVTRHTAPDHSASLAVWISALTSLRYRTIGHRAPIIKGAVVQPQTTRGDELRSGVASMRAEASPHQVPPDDLQMSVEPRRISPWIKELPYSLVLLLTIIGVAYTSFLKKPIVVYWDILAVVIGAICISTGWQSTDDKDAQWRLVRTQVLHWCAFLLVMNIILLPSVQKILNANVTGLFVFTLLALGTFTAGIHVASWQICVLGLVLALSIPAIAWIESSALIVVLVASVALGVGTVLWWHWHRKKPISD